MRLCRPSYRKGILLAALLALGVWFSLYRPQAVSAHPLGNFTINRYSGITLSYDHVALRYVLDMAEIPTFQEMRLIDQDGDGHTSEGEKAAYLEIKLKEMSGELRLSVNGSPVQLAVVEQALDFPPGQGGLLTLRLSALLRGAVPGVNQGSAHELFYQDKNYAERIGWREVVVRAGEGVSLLDSTAPQHDRSNELRSYPQDLLNSPPDQQEARSTFTLAAAGQSGEAPQPVETAAQPAESSSDMLRSLVSAERLSLPMVVISFLVALGLGAAHALSPGHGKTIMAAYLVGTRGTPVHAFFLGLTVTVSHTIGVIGLGFLVLYASHIIAPERLYPWLGLVSGVTIVAIGVWLLVSRTREGREPAHSHEHHDHPHPHPHQLPQSAGRLRVTWQSLTALGIVGGLVPSISALIILLAAISLHRVGFGLLLILAFSAGMAAVLAGIGLILVYSRRAVERVQFQNRLVGILGRFLPLTTALVVLVSGLIMAMRSAFQLGLV